MHRTGQVDEQKGDTAGGAVAYQAETIPLRIMGTGSDSRIDAQRLRMVSSNDPPEQLEGRLNTYACIMLTLRLDNLTTEPEEAIVHWEEYATDHSLHIDLPCKLRSAGHSHEPWA